MKFPLVGFDAGWAICFMYLKPFLLSGVMPLINGVVCFKYFVALTV